MSKAKQNNFKSKLLYKLWFPGFFLFVIIVFSLLFFWLLWENAQVKKDAGKIPPEVKDFLSRQSPESMLKTYPVPSSFRVPILLFHYVEYVKDQGDTIRKSLDITPYLFEQEVKTLKDANYTFITPSDLSNVIDGKVRMPKNPIILSFDDGYRDFYTDVFPILKRYQVKAVVYVVTGFLDKPNNMTTKMVQEVSGSGLVEIGDHTVNHLSLKGLSAEEAKFEVFQSKLALEKIIGKPVLTFAYPNGSFDVQAVKIVQEAGFKTAVTTVEGVDIKPAERLVLPRIRSGNKIGSDLLNLLSQHTFENN